MNKLDVLKLKTDIHLLQQKIEDGEKDLKTQEENETVLEKKLEKLAKEYDALVAQIAGSGYDQIATRKKDVQELLGQLNHSVQRWEQTSKDLKNGVISILRQIRQSGISRNLNREISQKMI